jgi:hypothetical protein
MPLFLFLSLFILHSHLLAESGIIFENPNRDFGIVTRKQELFHTFKFKNSGPDTVSITDVIPSCGCTPVNFSPGEYAPGDSGSISVKYTTNTSEGEFYKDIDVGVKYRRKVEHQQLKIFGITRKHISISPIRVDMNKFQLSVNSSDTTTVVWQRKEKLNPTLLSFPSSINSPTLLFEKVDTTTSKLKIAISLSEEAEAKYIRDSIVIATGSKLWPTISISLEGEIRGIHSFYPSNFLNMGAITKGSVIKQEIYLRSAVDVDSIKVSSPSLSKFKISAVSDSTKKIEMTLLPSITEDKELREVLEVQIFSGDLVTLKKILLTGEIR